MSATNSTTRVIIATASFSATKARRGAAASYLAFVVGGKTQATLKQAHPIEEPTSANRAAVLAVLAALQVITASNLTIELRTPSSYVARGLANLATWAGNGWKTRGGKAIAHADLWQQVNTYAKRHTITARHIEATEAIMADCKTAAGGRIIRERKVAGSEQQRAARQAQQIEQRQARREWDQRRRDERRRIAGGEPHARQSQTRQARPRNHRASTIRTITVR